MAAESTINSFGREKNLRTSESTQIALERVLQQLNSQGLFDISILECDNPYGFHEQIVPTPTATTTDHRNTNMTEETGHALQVSQEASISHGTGNDDTSIILETQEVDISGFEVGEKVKLLHVVHNIEVAVATISLMTSSTVLHNRLEPQGFYKVSIEHAIDGDAPLMLPNTDDNPPQLLVQNAIMTMIAWRSDRLQKFS